MSHDLSGLMGRFGHRTTRPRQAVWDALHRAAEPAGGPVAGPADPGPAGGHMTAEELARRVHEAAPDVNLASIYRTLALFKELGLVRESRLAGDGASHWELAHPDEHFHMVCDRCGRVDHHVGSLVAGIVDHLSSSHHFVPERVELVVHGHCVDCSVSTGGPG